MRRRLILSYLVLTMVVVVALEIPLGINYADHQRDELEANLQRDAFVLASSSADTLAGTGTVDLQALATNYSERTDGRVVIVDANGEVRADSDPPVEGTRSFADRPEIAEALDRRVAVGSRRSDTLDTTLLYVAVPVAQGGRVLGAVRISYATDQLDTQVHRYWFVLVAIAVVSLLAAAAVGLMLARWVAHPVEELQSVAAALGTGDLGARASTKRGPPEIRELAAEFNATAGRLEELVTAQEQFVADASHQLRTPLAALRLRLEMLEGAAADADGDPQAAIEDLAAAHQEVQRLSRLVDGLLALARAERSSSTATAEVLDLDAVLDERCAAWGPLADEYDVNLVADGAGLSARATPDRVGQVLDNLITNAIEASPPGGTIHLSARPAPTHGAPGAAGVDGRRVEVRVRDEGQGMTPEQRAHAFDRFWRGERTSSELGGTGLGLSIVQKLVHADSGDVELDEAAGGGLDVVVRLPGP